MRVQNATDRGRATALKMAAAVGSGLVGGVALGAIAGGEGVVWGLAIGLATGVIAGRIMTREDERATYMDRQLDAVLYDPVVCSEKASEEAASWKDDDPVVDEEPWGNEWLTPPPPVAG